MPHKSLVTAEDRISRGRTLWFTGLSGSGKSSVAMLVEQKLLEKGVPAYVLDGDNLRHGLNADLGFSMADRAENLRRLAHVAALLADSGHTVLVPAISHLPSIANWPAGCMPMPDSTLLRCSATLRLRIAREETPRGSTLRRVRVRLRVSPASTVLTSGQRIPTCGSQWTTTLTSWRSKSST